MKYDSLKEVVLLLFVFFYLACQSNLKAPISEEKLIDILVDVHTAEALTESEIQRVRDSMTPIYYAQIYEKHGVTKTDFDSTMVVYAHNPERFDSVYSKVLRIINTERDSLQIR
jgi:Domain of unknown function (DUF4296)